MKTKHILTAMVLPAMFAACTAEEIVENNNVAVNANFAQVESVGFTTTGFESRLQFNPETFTWDWEDTDKFILYVADDAKTLNESSASKTYYPGERFAVGTTLTTAYEYAKGENGAYVTDAPVMREGLYWGYAPALKEVGRGLVQYELAASQDAEYYKSEEAQAFITPLYEVSKVNYNNQLPLEMIHFYSTVVFSLNNDTDEDITLNQIVLSAEGGKKFVTKGLINTGAMGKYIMAYDGEEWAPMQNLNKKTTDDIKATKTMSVMEVYMDNFRKEYLAKEDAKNGKESSIMLLNLDGEVLEAGETKEFYMVVPAVNGEISCTITILADEGYVEIKSSNDSNYMHDTTINHNGKKSAFGWKTVKGETVAKTYSIEKLNKNNSKRYYVADYSDMMELIDDVNGSFEVVNVGDWNIDAEMADAITASDSYVTFAGHVNIGQNVEGRAASAEEIVLTKVRFKETVVVKENNVVTFSKKTNTKPNEIVGTLKIEEGADVTLEAGNYAEAEIVVEEGAKLTIDKNATTAQAADAENEIEASNAQIENFGETTLIEQPTVYVDMKGGKLNLNRHKDNVSLLYNGYASSMINFNQAYTCEVVVADKVLLTIDEETAVTRGYNTEDVYYAETLTVNGDLKIVEELTVSGYVTLNGDTKKNGSLVIERNGHVYNNGVCDANVTVEEGGSFFNNEDAKAKNVVKNDGYILTGDDSRIVVEAGKGRIDNTAGATVTANDDQTVFYLFSGDVDDLEEIPFEQFKVNTLRVEDELILDRPFTVGDAVITKQLASLENLELGNNASVEINGREGLIINAFKNVLVEGNLTIDGWKKSESTLQFYNPVTVTVTVKSKSKANDKSYYGLNISNLEILGDITWKEVKEQNGGFGWNDTEIVFDEATASSYCDYDYVDTTVDGTAITGQGTIVKTAAALKAAFAAGGEVSLAGDITLTESLEITEDLTIDLGEYTITTGNLASSITVKEAKVIFKGNGWITSNNQNMIVADEDGEIVFEGGKYDGTILSFAGTILVKDGYFKNSIKDLASTDGGPFGAAQYTCLNEQDSNRKTIVVKGGTFLNFNPACNWSEGEGTNFVHQDYIVKGMNITKGRPVEDGNERLAYNTTWSDDVEYTVVEK